MKDRRWFPVMYMFLVTAFFSFIVIAFAEITKENVEANRRLAVERCVLAVMNRLPENKVSGRRIHDIFAQQVNAPDESSRGAYTIEKDKRITTYALPISGQGFWSPIKGVIGLAADRKTITGICFYEQNETPGLGAQIMTKDFRGQFRDKVLAATEKPISIRRPGSQLGRSDVQAVTGATQTSIRLEKIINDAVNEWREKTKEGGT
jgi:Na+-transporting NADH:ubiquinone oxidoreductase subunit C